MTPTSSPSTSLVPPSSRERARVLRRIQHAGERNIYIVEAVRHTNKLAQEEVSGLELQRRGQSHEISKGYGRMPRASCMANVYGQERAGREFTYILVDHSLGYARKAFGAPLDRHFAPWFGPKQPLVVILGRGASIDLLTDLGVAVCLSIASCNVGKMPPSIWNDLPSLLASEEFKNQYRNIATSVVERLLVELEAERADIGDPSSETSPPSHRSLPPCFFNAFTDLLDHIRDHLQLYVYWIVIPAVVLLFGSSPPTLVRWWTRPWIEMTTSLVWAMLYYFFLLKWTLVLVHQNSQYPCWLCFRRKLTHHIGRTSFIILDFLNYGLFLYLFYTFVPRWLEPLPSFFLSVLVPKSDAVWTVPLWAFRAVPYVGRPVWLVVFCSGWFTEMEEERGRRCGCFVEESSQEQLSRALRG